MDDSAKKGRAAAWERLTEWLELAGLDGIKLEPWQEQKMLEIIDGRMQIGNRPRIVFMGTPSRPDSWVYKQFFSHLPIEFGVDMARPGSSDRTVHSCRCGYSSDCIEGLATHMVRRHNWPIGGLL